MAQEIFKAAAIARDLKQRLEIATGETVTESTDAENFPILVIGDSAIKVLHDAANDGRQDGIGQIQVSYTPHKIYYAKAETAQQNESQEALVQNEVTKCGTRILVSKKADTAGLVDAATAADVEDDAAFDALDKVADIKSDLINPLTSQM